MSPTPVARLVGVEANHVRYPPDDPDARPFAVLTLNAHEGDGRYVSHMVAVDEADLTNLLHGLLLSAEVLRDMSAHPEHDAGEAMTTVRDYLAMNPDCASGKHTACSGTAWDDGLDELGACTCTCHMAL